VNQFIDKGLKSCRNIMIFIYSILAKTIVRLLNNTIIERVRFYMCQYTVSILFKGKQYQTNVIADKSISDDEIYQLALEQVQKQWGERS
jgi:hypothetical protein